MTIVDYCRHSGTILADLNKSKLWPSAITGLCPARRLGVEIFRNQKVLIEARIEAIKSADSKAAVWIIWWDDEAAKRRLHGGVDLRAS